MIYASFLDKINEFHDKVGIYVDIGLAVLLVVCLCFVAQKVSKRKTFTPIILVSFLGLLVTVFFKMYVCAVMIGFLQILFFVWFSFNYSNNLKKLFKNKKKNSSKKLGTVEKQLLLDTIESAILDLSVSKTGAIITFETNEDLTDFINNGVKVEAPVTAELLKTIFYVGTPLHDGAVIIRGTNIEAASVFFTPSIKAMKGKYGARHRAAIGFSESHDAITVVVSEETGKIHFALQGELIPVSHDVFKKRLESYLDY